jgi:hypothetical protein
LLDGVAAAPVESACGVADPVVLLGAALSCMLEGDAGVEGVVVVLEGEVALCVVVVSVVVVLGVVVVLCASAIVPVKSRPAA